MKRRFCYVETVLHLKKAGDIMKSTQRVQLFRRRKRDDLIVVPFEVWRGEIQELVRQGLLSEKRTNDKSAIALALGDALDRAGLLMGGAYHG